MEFSPTSIEHLKTEEVTFYCNGVSWTEDGRIICAERDGVKIRRAADLRLEKTINIPNAKGVISAVQYGASLITNICTEDEYITYLGSLDDPTHHILHRTERESYEETEDDKEEEDNEESEDDEEAEDREDDESEEEGEDYYTSHVAANENHMAIADTVNKSLKVYSSITEEHLFDIQHTDFNKPYGVHLTHDDVLVTDLETGILYKYTLTPSPDLIWTCTGLDGAGAVTTDESGFIYVADMEGLIIHIISPSGQ